MKKQESLILDLSVIIPFKDKASLTLKAVETFIQYGPAVREFILISNNSSGKEMDVITRGMKDIPNAKIIRYNKPFNYQKINNFAVKQSVGKFILMMNNDIEFDKNSVGLVEKMYNKASKKDVGICGCTLLYGDKKHIQHAGVYLLPEGMADHLYVGKLYKNAVKNAESEKFPYNIMIDAKMTAVTGAFQLVEKRKFNTIDGMDERFIITGGDVDLCIRLNKKGYQTWFIGGGYIIHKESMSRRHISIPYSDFYYSYLSYITAYNTNTGDPFLPKITKNLKIWGK